MVYTGCGISMKSTTAATVSTLMTGIMRALERIMQRKLDTATPIDMVAAADLLNVVNEVLKNE